MTKTAPGPFTHKAEMLCRGRMRRRADREIN